MDPHGCDDFQSDTLKQRAAKIGRLAKYLLGVWVVKECHVIRRYDDETVDGYIYNGWALWEVGSGSAPPPP